MSTSDKPEPPSVLQGSASTLTPQAVRLRRAPTVCCAFFLGGITLWLTIGISTTSPLEYTQDPMRSLALIAADTMRFREGMAHAPTWARRLMELLDAEVEPSDLDELAGWFLELEEFSDDPVVSVARIVLEAESNGDPELPAIIEEWAGREDPHPLFADILTSAYAHVQPGPVLQAQLGRVVPSGWFLERLSLRLAQRAEDAEHVKAIEDGMVARAQQVFWFGVAFVLLGYTLVFLGLVALFAWWLRTAATQGLLGPMVLPPPWSAGLGSAVLVRGGTIGLVLSLLAMVVWTAIFPDDSLAILIAEVVTSGPLLFLVRRHLLVPHGLSLWQGLGLVLLRPVPWRRLGMWAFVGLWAVMAGDWVLAQAADAVQFSSHWTQWFDRDLAWGSPWAAAASLMGTCIVAPLCEEITFRGFIFATLRRRLPWFPSAVFSGALFAFVHTYDALGFASTLWCGIVWAWLYERTRSLWPGILSHAASNVLISASVMALRLAV